MRAGSCQTHVVEDAAQCIIAGHYILHHMPQEGLETGKKMRPKTTQVRPDIHDLSSTTTVRLITERKLLQIAICNLTPNG